MAIFGLFSSNTEEINVIYLSVVLQEWLDYIMYLTDFQQPTSSNLDILQAKWTSPMPMCWDPDSYNIGAYRAPYSSECDETESFEDLSDHYAVVSEFTFL